jgi:hypothetical protein
VTGGNLKGKREASQVKEENVNIRVGKIGKQ